jgi:hypothetical protein
MKLISSLAVMKALFQTNVEEAGGESGASKLNAIPSKVTRKSNSRKAVEFLKLNTTVAGSETSDG